jgi:putative FmdB family regulatory protein
MPIYEYRCRKCGAKFEDFHWEDEEDKNLKCPQCGEINMERVALSFSKSCGSGYCSPEQSA